MTLPTRISLTTYNLWNTEHLEERTPALEDFFRRFDSDIICVQEFRPELAALLDKNLPDHDRVAEQKYEPGWMCEGNIYYNNKMFDMVEFGAEEIGMKDKGYARRLWWAKLQLKATSQVIMVATVHFTWEGHADECATGTSPRVEYTHRVIEFFRKHHHTVDALIFCGDYNDRYHPRRILQKAEYIDTFSQLSLPMHRTWPTPSWNWCEDPLLASDFTCDFIFTCNRVKTLASQVLEHSYKGINPSDHFPLQAVLQLKPAEKPQPVASDSE